MSPRPDAALVHPGLADHLASAGHLPHAGRIERRTVAGRTASGDITYGWELVHRIHACRVADNASATEMRQQDGTVVVAAKICDLGSSFEVRETDRFVWTDGHDVERAFEIVGVRRASTDGRTRLFLEAA